jgi:hypothetical protein
MAFARGLVEGLAHAVLTLLGARGIPVSAEARAHIEATRDRATLDRWLVRAATAVSVEEVLRA